MKNKFRNIKKITIFAVPFFARLFFFYINILFFLILIITILNYFDQKKKNFYNSFQKKYIQKLDNKYFEKNEKEKNYQYSTSIRKLKNIFPELSNNKEL
ncbi:hypothetical protein, partial ['Cynodon dactylon' phytoplasma]|uniref:hypothetical protein n=1 Tax='Cynodon dactylon' phytoplasma TaxID=295320 RepID=UPI001265CF38